MSAIYDYHHTVTPSEIDEQGHANNVAYVEWMQAAAIAHSAARGWTADRYGRLGCGWVARAHWIEYHEPALCGEEIIVRTGVVTMTKVTSVRRYRMVRASDGALLALAETKWAFIDYATGRPRRILGEIAESFELAESI